MSIDWLRIQHPGTYRTHYNQDLTWDRFIEHAKATPELGLDTEGTGLSVIDGQDIAYGVGLSFEIPGVGQVSHYAPFRHRYGSNMDPRRLHQLQDMLSYRADNKIGSIVLHNAQHDLPALKTLGIDYQGPVIDTMVIAQLVNENFPFTKGLGPLCKHYLGVDKKEPPGEKMWANMPAEMLWEYGAHDPLITYRLWVDGLKPLFEKEDLGEVWEQKQRTMRILLKMRERGVAVDREHCEEQYRIGTAIMADVVEMLDLNPGSPKDLAKLFLDVLELPVVKRTDKGAPSFDKEAMEEYDEILERKEGSEAQLVKTYRGWQKVTSSCYKAYLDHSSPDGRLRTNYHQHRTLTGRLSSSEPNLQQIPRQSNKEWHRRVKSSFIGRPGYVLVEGDYSQLEFRLATAYASEPALAEVFNSDRDVFDEMSEQLGMQRQDTKTLTYTLSYGGGVNRIKNVFGVEAAKAAEIRQNFYTQYSNLKKTSDHVAAWAAQNGYVKYWNGRRRHFNNPKKQAHKAFNSVMQGGAADIVECAMDRCDQTVDNDECRMLLQVHDSVVFEVREDKVEYYSPIIKEVMEDVTAKNGKTFGVKFKVDVHPFSK